MKKILNSYKFLFIIGIIIGIFISFLTYNILGSKANLANKEFCFFWMIPLTIVIILLTCLLKSNSKIQHNVTIIFLIILNLNFGYNSFTNIQKTKEHIKEETIKQNNYFLYEEYINTGYKVKKNINENINILEIKEKERKYYLNLMFSEFSLLIILATILASITVCFNIEKRDIDFIKDRYQNYNYDIKEYEELKNLIEEKLKELIYFNFDKNLKLQLNYYLKELEKKHKRQEEEEEKNKNKDKNKNN